MKSLFALACFIFSFATIGCSQKITEKDIPASKATDQTFAGTGSSEKEHRADYTDKADPIREHDCIWCMACVSVCPPQAIKVDQSNLEHHEKAAGTFKKMETGSVNPHAHH